MRYIKCEHWGSIGVRGDWVVGTRVFSNRQWWRPLSSLAVWEVVVMQLSSLPCLSSPCCPALPAHWCSCLWEAKDSGPWDCFAMAWTKWPGLVCGGMVVSAAWQWAVGATHVSCPHTTSSPGWQPPTSSGIPTSLCVSCCSTVSTASLSHTVSTAPLCQLLPCVTLCQLLPL